MIDHHCHLCMKSNAHTVMITIVITFMNKTNWLCWIFCMPIVVLLNRLVDIWVSIFLSWWTSWTFFDLSLLIDVYINASLISSTKRNDVNDVMLSRIIRNILDSPDILSLTSYCLTISMNDSQPWDHVNVSAQTYLHPSFMHRWRESIVFFLLLLLLWSSSTQKSSHHLITIIFLIECTQSYRTWCTCKTRYV